MKRATKTDKKTAKPGKGGSASGAKASKKTTKKRAAQAAKHTKKAPAQAYNHKAIESKWQQYWTVKKIDLVKDSVPGKKNEYLLVEFPYPSGNLHVGHWYAFTMPDIYARFRRAQGKNVLFPIGFDAFGLPAENAAIKNGLNPRKWTYANIAHMKKQIAIMGASFDWSRTLATCDPDYYRWTQWQFLQFYKNGLAYQKETPANWCPKDKTVLANEQVIAGRCERCGTEVEQRNMLQWNLRITDYADRLIDDLEPLDWPEQIKDAQRNWIGRSEGAEIDFALDFEDKTENARVGIGETKPHITVFTTRADTLFGATYLVLAPEHPWVKDVLKRKTVLGNNDQVYEYVLAAAKKTELERQESKEKTGVELKGVRAINPASGESIPIFVADYVLAGYGTGAIMAVPAHDERDYTFAKKFDLPIKQVIEPTYLQTTEPGKIREGEPFDHREAIIAIVKHWSEEKYIALKWKQVAWGTFITGGIEAGQTPESAAKAELLEEVGYKNARFVKDFGVVHGKFYHVPKKVNRNAHAHMVYLELEDDARAEVEAKEQAIHDPLWLSKEELKKFLTPDTHKHFLRLLNGEEVVYTDFGTLANSGEFDRLESKEARRIMTEKFGRAKKTYRLRDWGISRQRYWGVPIPIIHCETCGAIPVTDKDLPVVLPEIKDYLPTGDGKSPLAKAIKWINVKCPKCKGNAKRETDTFDTFVDSSWYFLRYVDPKDKKQFSSLDKQKAWMPIDMYSGGAEHTTMHVLYSRFWQKALYDLKLVRDKEPYTRRMNRGLILGPDGAKMSKSKGNVIDPDAVVARLGADTVRMYLAFIGPFNEPGSYPWNPDSIAGVRRFLERLWRLQEKIAAKPDADVERLLHQTIKKVGEDCAAFKFNTAIAQMMTLLNTAEANGITAKQYATFVRVLAPFAPHITEELWSKLGNKKSVHLELWPKYDAKKLVAGTMTIAIQVSGKTRGEVTVAADADQKTIEAAARKIVAARLEGATVIKTIYVPNRLVNFVVSV